MEHDHYSSAAGCVRLTGRDKLGMNISKLMVIEHGKSFPKIHPSDVGSLGFYSTIDCQKGLA